MLDHVNAAGRDAVTAGSASRDLAVVIPTLNEVGNVRSLLAKLEIALAGISWEAIFVDDNSTDGTDQELEALAKADTRVRVIRRIGRRGLSSAVVEGNS